jgi:hypothetical protein
VSTSAGMLSNDAVGVAVAVAFSEDVTGDFGLPICCSDLKHCWKCEDFCGKGYKYVLIAAGRRLLAFARIGPKQNSNCCICPFASRIL